MSDSFEKRLKNLLEKKQISVSELAKETGVPVTNIRQWLTGTAPNIRQVDKVAQFFNMSVDELFFGRQPRPARLENILNEIHVHDGVYKVSITKLANKE